MNSATTASTFSAIKGVKMLGLTEKLSKTIQALRLTELQSAKAFRQIKVVTAFFGICSNFDIVRTPGVTNRIDSVLTQNDFPSHHFCNVHHFSQQKWRSLCLISSIHIHINISA